MYVSDLPNLTHCKFTYNQIMKKVEEPESESESISQELQENDLMIMNKHFRNRKNNRSNKGSAETQALYKQALMDAIFGRFEDASKKLKHIITLSPDNPQPYHLLGTMHQEIGEFDKAVEYLFMSTYLSPPNLQRWIKVADISFELKMYEQAAYCYGRALKIQNYNIDLMAKRAQAFEHSKQMKKAVLTYKKILNISKSTQIMKKYAKLRFKRGQYSQSRQILQSLQDYHTSKHLINMVCQTYLKQHKYDKIMPTISSYYDAVPSQSIENLQEMPLEFVKMILICQIVNYQDQRFNASKLVDLLIESYDEEYAELFTDIIQHIKSKNQEITYVLLKYMLQFKAHKTVENYLYVTEWLKKEKSFELSLKYINEGIKIHPNSAQLFTQKNYLKKCSGIKNSKMDFPAPRQIYKNDDIYDSESEQSNIKFDQDEEFIIQNVKQNKKPIKKEKKPKQVQTQDPQVLSKLLQNASQSMEMILDQISSQAFPKASHHFQDVYNSLDFLISISPMNKSKSTTEDNQIQGLYFKHHTRKRNITVDSTQRDNFIHSNIEVIASYIQNLIRFLTKLINQNQFKKIIQISQKISKAHFFKWQNRNEKFKDFKIQIYQITLLACISIKKYNTGIFFIKFLLSRQPQNTLYLLIANVLSKVCSKKTSLTSMISKYIDLQQSQKLQSMSYLLGVQYMETGNFDLAINSLLRIQSTPDIQIRKQVNLCLSSCLIQIASSRNTYNKMDFTNRSAFCFASYSQKQEESPQVIFNRARWFAQVKINSKATLYFNRILSLQCDEDLKKQAAYCLMCIYKEAENYEKLQQIQGKYFRIDDK